MSSYGAIPIDSRLVPFDALVAASGKCLEGVPGMGFVIVRQSALEQATGNSHSLVLDLADQWQYMRKTGQWRYTPPTHVMAALRAAVDQFRAQGGQPARLARYQKNCATLIAGMRSLGLRSFLPEALQAPIIVTFHAPADPHYEFGEFYRRVRDRDSFSTRASSPASRRFGWAASALSKQGFCARPSRRSARFCGRWASE
jgi:2-aminoethylphosphonate-pyruvate transaminase